MCKSLIDSIGRDAAYRLIEGAVLQAIEENHHHGLVDTLKTVQVVNGALCITGPGGNTPFVPNRDGSSARPTLTKKSLQSTPASWP
jgi:hypothetical protein